MKRFFIIVVLSYFCHTLAAQNGFIRIYSHLDSVATGFNNMLHLNDTLLLFGLTYDTLSGQQGFLFYKLDTLGEILVKKIHIDSFGDHYFSEYGYEIIKTSDGGYAANGVNLNSRNAFLIKLDSNLNIQYVKEYPDPPPNVRTTRPRGIVEIPGGYLISGVKQRSDYLNDIFIMKVDKSGNYHWRKFYGESNLAESGKIVLKNSDNAYIVGGGVSFQEGPKEDRWYQTWIFEMDSIGNKQWEWRSEKELEHLEFGGSIENIQLDNGDQVFLSGYWYYYDVDFYDTKTQGRIICTDSSFTKKWEYIAGIPSSPFNGLRGLIHTQDRGYVAVGNYYTSISGFDGNRISHMVKLDSVGNFLWERIDTINAHPEYGAQNNATQVVELSSGSLMVCGTGKYLDYDEGGYPYNYGYIIKTDEEGCLEPGCRAVKTADVSYNYDLNVYPNPTSGIITFEWDKSEMRLLKIYDVNGKFIGESKLMAEKSIFNMSSFPSGTYILQVLSKEGVLLDIKKVLVQY